MSRCTTRPRILFLLPVAVAGLLVGLLVGAGAASGQATGAGDVTADRQCGRHARLL